MRNIFDFDEGEMKTILKQQFLEGKMKLEIEEASGGVDVDGDGTTDVQIGVQEQKKKGKATRQMIKEELMESILMNESFVIEVPKSENYMLIQDKFNLSNPINYLNDFADALKEGIVLDLNKSK